MHFMNFFYVIDLPSNKTIDIHLFEPNKNILFQKFLFTKIQIVELMTKSVKIMIRIIWLEQLNNTMHVIIFRNVFVFVHG